MSPHVRRLLALAAAKLSEVLDDLAAHLGGPPEWCWRVTDEGTHFYPLLDSVAHEPTEDCACGPTSRLEQCEEHGDAWFWRHHPLTQPNVED